VPSALAQCEKNNMTQRAITFRNGQIFDGAHLRQGHAIRFAAGQATALGPDADIAKDGEVVDLAGDILSPGFVDLQVNGGDGIMFNDSPSVASLRRIAMAHRRLGVMALLPTLITDTPEKTRAAISAATEAVRQGVPGIAGLHLEGPHLCAARKGAHDPALIRPMGQDDLEALLLAKAALPVLMVTVAPENVTVEQVAMLAHAGILVSLGHSDADYDTCCRYFNAGARCATHLFNAMSQLGSRAPGLVGAALSCGGAFAGLIADTVHVHPETMRVAWAAKTGPGRIFLVSDAMAIAGTDRTEFELGGRRVRRRNGALMLDDGTLAGADLDLTTAIGVLIQKSGVAAEQALQAATSVPAALIGRPITRLDRPEAKLADLVRISADFSGIVALD
jgi:N-acetylglucosamine-6-phosphate deacetylase